jgi:hypothetical protein
MYLDTLGTGRKSTEMEHQMKHLEKAITNSPYELKP